ncbi:YhgE/Pip domain-containing protein [Paenibacillus sp. NEAU-GSW1]|uniref:YhgE/Pip domain-containing protein n=1 Tax=Paenibacillus sp. NEAU-GSW1 TaxID=2682486 RepID=UPI0012E28B17|nr:DUF3533 domain-containing protein [Paenibacillus sp. NEAU-GSW1]MUT68539.1 DUF3533 domain-containing protein [Paenibacillus sp. NEAU-GSW1]
MEKAKQIMANKLIWIGLIGVVAVIFIMGLAQLGSSSNPVPKNLPVAVVMLDKEVQLPNGQSLAIGNLILQQVTAAPAEGTDAPLKWEVLGSVDEALAGLDAREYYSVLVLPDNLSANVASLLSPSPQAATIKAYVNQGMNTTGANMASQVITKIGESVNHHLREQLLETIKAQGDSLNTAQAALLASPIAIQAETVHPVPAHSANGNAPVAFTILAWFGAIIASVLTTLAIGKLRSANRLGNAGLIAVQAIIGLLYCAAALGATLLLAKSTLGMSIENIGNFSVYFALVCYSFFFLQTCLLNWLGMKGMPIVILIFFFGSPILGLPSQMLPAFSQNWLYSWIPLRFGAETLRESLYFGGASLSSSSTTTLVISAAVAFVLSLIAASALPYRAASKAVPAEETTV